MTTQRLLQSCYVVFVIQLLDCFASYCIVALVDFMKSIFNQSPSIQKSCKTRPPGWTLPSRYEFDILGLGIFFFAFLHYVNFNLIFFYLEDNGFVFEKFWIKWTEGKKIPWEKIAIEKILLLRKNWTIMVATRAVQPRVAIAWLYWCKWTSYVWKGIIADGTETAYRQSAHSATHLILQFRVILTIIWSRLS